MSMGNSVQMHEFLASGGVFNGVDPATKTVIWTDPVDLDDATKPLPELCPWHGDMVPGGYCGGWELIKRGVRSGEPAPSPTLSELREKSEEELIDIATHANIAMAQKMPVVVMTQADLLAQQQQRQPVIRQHTHVRNIMNQEKAFMNITDDIPDEITFGEDEGGEEEESE